MAAPWIGLAIERESTAEGPSSFATVNSSTSSAWTTRSWYPTFAPVVLNWLTTAVTLATAGIIVPSTAVSFSFGTRSETALVASEASVIW